ncbi:hypothetical protein CsatB_015674 [Cannabis sativa]
MDDWIPNDIFIDPNINWDEVNWDQLDDDFHQSNKADKIIIQDNGINLEAISIETDHEINKAMKEEPIDEQNSFNSLSSSEQLLPVVVNHQQTNCLSDQENTDKLEIMLSPLESSTSSSSVTNTNTYQFCYTYQLVPQLAHPNNYWDQSNNKKEAQIITITDTFPIPTPTSVLTIKDQQKLTSSNYGRWTEKEHMIFLQGLNMFGSGNWTEISTLLGGTRTPTQVASHAKKYFKKILKEEEIARTTSENNNNKKLNKSINDIRVREDGSVSFLD